MIFLHNVRWMNFLSTGNIFSEIKLSQARMTLICGDNGSGKSTMMDAICYALFNKPFRKINKPQLINSVTNKNMLVEIELTANNKQYLIRRGLKPTVFEIYQDGNLINQSADQRDYQQVIEQNILKFNYKTFCQIVILGSANFTPFMQLPAAQRRQIIEDLLDIQVFSTMNILLKDRIATNKDQLNDVNNQINLTSKLIELNNQHANRLKEDNDQAIAIKRQQIERHLADNVNIQKLLDSKQLKLNSLSSKVSDARQSVEQKIDKTTSIQVKYNRVIANANKRIEFYSNSSECSTCNQPITEQFKDKQILSSEQDKVVAQDKLDQLTIILNQLHEKIAKINQSVQKVNELVTDIAKLNTDINTNNVMIRSLSEQIQQLSTIESNSVDNSQYYSQIEQLSNQRQTLSDNRELLNVASVLLKDSGIKTQIIKQYIPIINKLINKYLDHLEFFCQFTIDENFQESIKSRYRDEFTYDSFSQGEKMRIDLSLMFAWREIAAIRNSASINLLVLDEVMDSSLDSSGTDEFIKIIQQLTGNNNVFIISHKQDQIFDKFDHVINVQKIKNFSKIV